LFSCYGRKENDKWALVREKEENTQTPETFHIPLKTPAPVKKLWTPVAHGLSNAMLEAFKRDRKTVRHETGGKGKWIWRVKTNAIEQEAEYWENAAAVKQEIKKTGRLETFDDGGLAYGTRSIGTEADDADEEKGW
jgi:hypothetical protein